MLRTVSGLDSVRLGLDRVRAAVGEIDSAFLDTPALPCEPLGRARGGLLLSRRRVSAHGDDEPVAGSAVELGRQQREEDREGLSVEAEPVAAVGFTRNDWRTR
jgi:hypothetical protein